MRLNGRLMATVAFLAVMGAGVDAAAQARVTGEITDEWGNGLPGVLVTAERDGGGAPVTTETDDNGEFFMIGLSSAQYNITFTRDGYQGIRTPALVRMRDNQPINLELEALPTGSRLRGEQEFQAAGGTPWMKFNEEGFFEFEDADGEEGMGTYGIVEQDALLVVREYDGDDDKFSIVEPVVVSFSSDQFTSFTWDGVELTKQ